MTAELLVEAVDTAITLGWALAAWIAVLAAARTLTLLGVTAASAYAIRALRRAYNAPSQARRRTPGRILARTRARRSEKRVEPSEYREAA